MKTSMLRIIAIAALMGIPCAALAKDGGGSIGTTGGGDYRVALQEILPKSAQVSQTFKPSKYAVTRCGTVEIGTRPGWGGVWTLTTYANQVQLITSFDRSKLSTPDRGISRRVFLSWNGKQGKEFSLTHKAVTCYLNFMPSSSEGFRRSFWLEGTQVSMERLKDVFLVASHAVIEQVEWNVPETFAPLPIVDQILGVQYMSESRERKYGLWTDLIGSAPPEPEFGNTQHTVGVELLRALDAQAQAFGKLAQAAVLQDGSCGAEAFDQLQSGLRQWTLGNKLYLDTLFKRYGFQLTPSLDLNIYNVRARIFQLYWDSVLPVCGPKNAGRAVDPSELILTPEAPQAQ